MPLLIHAGIKAEHCNLKGDPRPHAFIGSIYFNGHTSSLTGRTYMLINNRNIYHCRRSLTDYGVALLCSYKTVIVYGCGKVGRYIARMSAVTLLFVIPSQVVAWWPHAIIMLSSWVNGGLARMGEIISNWHTMCYSFLTDAIQCNKLRI